MRARTQLFELQIDPGRMPKGRSMPATEESIFVEFQVSAKDATPRAIRPISIYGRAEAQGQEPLHHL